EYLLIPRVVAQGVEIGVVLEPLSQIGSDARKRTLQQVKRRVRIAQFCVTAGEIVLSERIVGIDRKSSGHPFPGAILFTNLQQCSDAEVGWSWILRVKSKF